jgi:hypothetical protein
MHHSDFPWRPLGRVLVDDELLAATQLERALAEQRRSGRLLGQVLVAQGYVTGTELTRALARQHGVEVRAGGATPDRDNQPQARATWRSLGMLLSEKGFVSPAALQRALAEQRDHPHRRLGEILVEFGSLSPRTLASVVAEQHGVSPDTELVADAGTPSAIPAGPTYAVFAVDGHSTARRELCAAASLLDAADAACDYIDERFPLGVEIELQEAGRTELVWTYSQERAAGAASSSKTLLQTYGFDPNRWGS